MLHVSIDYFEISYEFEVHMSLLNTSSHTHVSTLEARHVHSFQAWAVTCSSTALVVLNFGTPPSFVRLIYKFLLMFQHLIFNDPIYGMQI